MKNRYILFIFLITFAFQLIFSQEETAKGPSSKIKNSLSEKGKVLIKDFYSLGSIKGSAGGTMEINALVLYEPGRETERLRGLKISISGNETDKRTYSMYLDYDEMENFNKVIVYMIQAAASWKYTTKDSSEATFSTKDNFRFGFFQRGNEQSCFAECLYGGKLSVFFDMEDLKTVKRILDNAKTILLAK